MFSVEVTETGTGKEARLSLKVKKNEERYQWALETGGSYILRTNWGETDPKTLWNTYIQLSCFRVNLQIFPDFGQTSRMRRPNHSRCRHPKNPRHFRTRIPHPLHRHLT